MCMAFVFSQKPDEWVEPLKDVQVKEGRDKIAVFKCRFSRPNCIPKWTKRAEEIFQVCRTTEKPLIYSITSKH